MIPCYTIAEEAENNIITDEPVGTPAEVPAEENETPADTVYHLLKKHRKHQLSLLKRNRTRQKKQ